MSRTQRNNSTGRDSQSIVPSSFKKDQRRKRRAMEKDALRHGEDLPKFRRCDEWEYL